MNPELVDKIARAVLYEGYILYPYRPSAIKNRQRWSFGVLYPEAWVVGQSGSDRSYLQMECLAIGSLHSKLQPTLRFLHLVSRARDDEAQWEEAIERSIRVDEVCLNALVSDRLRQSFSFPATERSEQGLIYKQELLQGEVELSATRVHDQIFQIRVRVQNTTPLKNLNRSEALLRSLASAHVVLHLKDGEFVSQTDPAESLSAVAEHCENIGVWPVLAGEKGSLDTMLGSPTILPDYPQVAPESSGDLFDATEIDEILSLRILTMTDAEKAEMRESDEHARRILERLETNPAEHLMQLHGTIRGMRSENWTEGPQLASTRVGGIELGRGSRVRLRPGKRADIFDTLLEGKIAVIEAIEQDFENNIHFAVVIEDDPGRDLGEMRQAGHRFFFSSSEIETLHE